MKKKSILISFLVASMVLSGCSSNESVSNVDTKNASSETYVENSADFVEVNKDDMFTERDYKVEYDISNSCKIELNGSSAACSSDAVKIDGNKITVSDEGTYILSGTLDDGMIVVNAGDQDKLQLVFDGVDINSENCAPIYILEADKVFITLAENSENKLSNGGVFETIDENNIDSVIFSKQDLTINGSGTLTITSPAGHGIVSKDVLVFTGGLYNIDAASHGLDANDSIRITNVEMNISSGRDGIHAENEDDTSLGYVYIADGKFNIESECDGVSASSYMQIDDGEFSITSGGGSNNAIQKSGESFNGFGMEMPNGEKHNKRQTNFQENGENSLEQSIPDDFENKQEMIPEDMSDTEMKFNDDEKRNHEQRGKMDVPPEMNENISDDIVDMADKNGVEQGEQNLDENNISAKGIKATGNILILNGTFNINSSDDSIHSNSSIKVNGGIFKILTGDDGFHADAELIIEHKKSVEKLYIS